MDRTELLATLAEKYRALDALTVDLCTITSVSLAGNLLTEDELQLVNSAISGLANARDEDLSQICGPIEIEEATPPSRYVCPEGHDILDTGCYLEQTYEGRSSAAMEVAENGDLLADLCTKKDEYEETTDSVVRCSACDTELPDLEWEWSA